MSSRVLTIGEEPDPSQRLRDEWAASLAEHMEAQDISRKELRRRLAELDPPVVVSRQAIDQWLAGITAPRPHHQAGCAAVLKVPAHRLFSLAPAKAAS